MSEIDSQSVSDLDTPRVFKVEGRIYFLLVLLLIDGLFLFMGYAIESGRHIRQESFSSGELFFLAIILLLALLSFITIKGQSDVVVDRHGISRRFLRWTWKTIRWNNIQLIKTLPFFNPALRKMVRIIVIFPSVRPRFRLSPAGSMSFMDVLVNMDELIKIINQNATQYKIRIEATESGIDTTATHL